MDRTITVFLYEKKQPAILVEDQALYSRLLVEDLNLTARPINDGRTLAPGQVSSAPFSCVAVGLMMQWVPPHPATCRRFMRYVSIVGRLGQVQNLDLYKLGTGKPKKQICFVEGNVHGCSSFQKNT